MMIKFIFLFTLLLCVFAQEITTDNDDNVEHAVSNEQHRRLGTCPRVRKGMLGFCAELCTSDSDCPIGEKCCSNGCGHVCKKACILAFCKCPYGRIDYYDDDNGCRMCRCKKPCPAFVEMCVYCENGYLTDENGCRTCKCT